MAVQSPIQYEQLIQRLEAEFTRERELTLQVMQHVASHYGVGFEQVARFLAERLGDLEDYEVDLILSPLFTPRLEERARFSDLLDGGGIEAETLEEVVDLLCRKGIRATIRYGEEIYHPSLHRVTIARYVRLLNLTTPLAPEVIQGIHLRVPLEEVDRVKALARDPAWRGPQRERILLTFLEAFSRRGNFTLEKVEFLTGLVHTNRPQSLVDMEGHLLHLIEAYEEEQVGQKFYDTQLKEAYANKDLTRPDDHRLEANRRHRLALSRELLEDLRSVTFSSRWG